MKLNQNIETHNTSGITTYPDAKSFVESLDQYLRVDTQLPAGLSLISVGENTPSQLYQNAPWIQTDENNNPTALKMWNGAEWRSLAPDISIKAGLPGFVIQSGSGSFAIETAANVTGNSNTSRMVNGTKTGGDFPFTQQFTDTPIVIITPKASTIFDVLTTYENTNFYWRLNETNNSGFNVAYSFTEVNGIVESADVVLNSKSVKVYSDITTQTVDVASANHTHNVTVEEKTVSSTNHVHEQATNNNGDQTGLPEIVTNATAGGHEEDIYVIPNADVSGTPTRTQAGVVTTIDGSAQPGLQTVVSGAVAPDVDVLKDTTTLTNNSRMKESFNNKYPISQAPSPLVMEFNYIVMGKIE